MKSILIYLNEALFGQDLVFKLATGEQVQVIETNYGYLTIKKAA